MRYLMLAVFVGGALYLALQSRREEPSAPPLPGPAAAPRPSPALSLPPEELAKVRRSAADPDPAVRWAAIELLCVLKDQAAYEALEKTIAQDQDPAARLRAVSALLRAGGAAALPGLSLALRDADKDVRLAALRAVGDVGDPAVAPAVTELLRDAEPEVRAEALRALGQVQDRRRAEFQKLSEQLRKDYEAALRRKEGGSALKLERPKEIKVE